MYEHFRTITQLQSLALTIPLLALCLLVIIEIRKPACETCLNFSKKHLITGASKENFDCTWQVYWDDGNNPSRTLNIDNVPYIKDYDNPIQSYRDYYHLDKATFASWKYRDKPHWWSEDYADYENRITRQP